MSIKAIIFDLDDTLVAQDASDDAAFLAASELAAQKFAVDPAQLAQAARRHAHKLWRGAETGPYCMALGIGSTEGLWAHFAGDDPNLQRLREWSPVYRHLVWRAALGELGVRDESLGDPHVTAPYVETFARERRARHVLFEETETVLRDLADRYRLGLLTNGAPDLQREKIAGSGLAHYFDAIVISGDHGVGKPDPRIFGLTLSALGVEAREAVMVGNSLEADMVGAKRAGIYAIWVNRTGEARPNGDVFDMEITSLQDLPYVRNRQR